MEFKELKSKVERAIKSFFKHDSFLVKKNINTNERSVTHKLAEYLQKEFSEYHVDCEYNKMVEDSDFITKKLELIPEDIKSDDKKAKTVYPDIIIHNREKSEDNLLVIEVKKETNANENDINFDIKKIEAYIKQLKYKNGLFIKIGNNYDSTIEIFVRYDKNIGIIKRICDNYKSHYNDFIIEIIENKIISRSTYKDIKISYILKIKNVNDPDWKIPISNPAGYINNKQDRNKLLIKVMKEVKERIDLCCDDDNVDNIIIGELTLDLTTRRNKL